MIVVEIAVGNLIRVRKKYFSKSKLKKAPYDNIMISSLRISLHDISYPIILSYDCKLSSGWK